MTAVSIPPFFSLGVRGFAPAARPSIPSRAIAPETSPSKADRSRIDPGCRSHRIDRSDRVAPGSEADIDDLAWVAKVRDGDEDAARILVDRLYPTVIKCVRYRLPRRTSEEDLAQAIFARIFAHLDQFSGTVPLEHWVSRIAVNTCLNQLKHERVRPELRMSDLREEEEAVVQRLLHTADDLSAGQAAAARELLDRLMARLRPDERLVVTLLHLEERTIKEISELTGWSITLVKVKAFRARQKLRKLWQSLADGERL